MSVQQPFDFGRSSRTGDDFDFLPRDSLIGGVVGITPARFENMLLRGCAAPSFGDVGVSIVSSATARSMERGARPVLASVWIDPEVATSSAAFAAEHSSRTFSKAAAVVDRSTTFASSEASSSDRDGNRPSTSA